MEKKQSEFNKVFSAWDILVIAFGAMIGWGWVVSSGGWIQKGGVLGAALGFVVGGVMIFFVGLTYAELTAAMPQCGGEHVWSHRAMGPTGSFVCTWAIVLGYVGVACFEACAFPTIISYLWPGFLKGYLYTVAGFDIYASWLIVAILVAFGIMLINIVGAKTAAKLQTILTIIIGGAGIMLIVASVINGTVDNLDGQMFAEVGGGGIVKSILSVAISFLILRKKQPDMPRPYKVPAGRLMGGIAVLMSGFMVVMYCIPGSGGTLILPEWGMVAAWSALGVVFFAICKSKYRESFGSMVQLISDEDAATLLPEADERELDKVIDGAIDRVLARLA